MQSPDGAQAADTVHAGWRMTVAGQAARVYAENREVAAMAVAGSVGAGLADQFSDLELDCYWLRPPSDEERLAPVRALGGELSALWEYDPGDAEWSEDYLVGDLGVTVSNFLASTVGQFLDDVLLRSSTDPVQHMRLAALQRSRPLLGAETMAAWRNRAETFPRPLVSALVEQALTPEVLTGWSAREAFLDRGDSLALRDLMVRTGHAAVRAVLALNHVYLPHRQLKWQHQLTTGLRLAPSRFAERLKVMSDGPAGEALPAAETLLAETVTLAVSHCDADLTDFREMLSERRRAIGAPPPGVP